MATLIVASAVGLALSLVELYLDYSSEEERLERRVDQALTIALPTAIRAVELLDRGLAEEVLEGLVAEDSVSAAEIRDETGDTLARSAGPSANDQGVAQSVLIEKRELPVENNTGAGQIIIHVDREKALESFIRRSWIILISAVVKSFLIGLILLLVFERLVSRPLKQLSAAFQNLNPQKAIEGNLDFPEGHEGDEFGMVVERSNELLGRIQYLMTEQTIQERLLRERRQKETIGSFSVGIAHNINNSLTPVLALSELMRKDFKPGDSHYADLTEISDCVKRSRHLIDQLLEYSEGVSDEPLPIDGRKLSSHILERLEKQSTDKIVIESDVEANLPRIKVFPDRIIQGIESLVQNSVESIVDEGRIKLFIARETVDTLINGSPDQILPGKYLTISITDNGHGMDEVTLRQATDPFFTTKGIESHLGLGLAIFHQLMHQLHGGLTIESSEGVGTTVKIWFPTIGIH